MLVPTFTLLVITVLLFAYVFAVRPWHTAWGATHVDRVARLPGDELSPRAYHIITHAVNIQAPPEAIWPWIVQIGQDRSGFYSYTFLENLAGCDMPRVQKIVPEWQNRAAGDTVWFATPKQLRRARAHGGHDRRAPAFADAGHSRRLEALPERRRRPGHHLDLCARSQARRHDATDRSRCARWRIRALPRECVNYVFWEPAHFIMERKMLLTIKHLAEEHVRQV